ncbi:MAG: lytic transglycosylase domain-containing protein [Pelagibaca sp.]
MTRYPPLLAACTVAINTSFAQGVPVNDSGLTARDILETHAREIDLAAQQQKLSLQEILTGIEQEQRAVLQNILDAQTSFDAPALSGRVSELETGAGDMAHAAPATYGSGNLDPNPGSAQMFGDAAETIEQLIIRVARDTHDRPGVERAGLSVVQWRALLQALIWQESRFSIGARSPVGAFGLTQIMPGTAGDLGIYPAYYDSPYLQVEGGARYLSAQMARFDGNIINALAAYNAGPGRVIEYGGVPPFAETQHYVRVIPERYNFYLARIGGIEALGTIDLALMANAQLSLTGHGAAFYGAHSPAAIRLAALRVRDIVTQIGETRDIQESLALNTYARAELVRLIAARLRLKAVRTKPLAAAQLAQAATQRTEAAFMTVTVEDLE